MPKVYWADKHRTPQPLAFYHNRESFYLTEPSAIVTQMVDGAGEDDDLQSVVVDNALRVMKSPEPAYLLGAGATFDMMKQFAGVEGKSLARIPNDPKHPEKDVLIVANDAHRAK